VAGSCSALNAVVYARLCSMHDTPNVEQPEPGGAPEQTAEAQRGLVMDAIAGAAVVQAADLGAQIIVDKLRDMVGGPADPGTAPAVADAPDDGGFPDAP
jgi:hypothetical protein